MFDGVTALLCLAEGGGSLVLTTLAPGTITTLPGRVIAGNRRRANKNIMLLNITIHPSWNPKKKTFDSPSKLKGSSFQGTASVTFMDCQRTVNEIKYNKDNMDKSSRCPKYFQKYPEFLKEVYRKPRS